MRDLSLPESRELEPGRAGMAGTGFLDPEVWGPVGKAIHSRLSCLQAMVCLPQPAS